MAEAGPPAREAGEIAAPRPGVSVAYRDGMDRRWWIALILTTLSFAAPAVASKRERAMSEMAAKREQDTNRQAKRAAKARYRKVFSRTDRASLRRTAERRRSRNRGWDGRLHRRIERSRLPAAQRAEIRAFMRQVERLGLRLVESSPLLMHGPGISSTYEGRRAGQLVRLDITFSGEVGNASVGQTVVLRRRVGENFRYVTHHVTLHAHSVRDPQSRYETGDPALAAL